MQHSLLKKTFTTLLLALSVCSFSSASLSANNNSAKPPAVKQIAIEQTVNINKANAEQIAASLKGIGIKKAQAIVEWRKTQGKFTSINQLLNIKGIGEKTLERNKSNIKL